MLKQLQEKFSTQSEPPATPPSAPSPGCPACGSSRFWFDRFDRGPHCVTCKPAPSKTLIGRIVDMSELATSPEPPGAEPSHATDGTSLDEASPADDAAADREFDRHWSTTITLDGRTIVERRGWSTPEIRLAIECLDSQERRAAARADLQILESL